MTGINADGADGIDMYPEAVRAVLDALVAAGGDLRSGWAGHLARISALDGQLGNGPLGRAIAGQYNEAAAQLGEGVDAMTRRVEDLGRVGGEIVRTYVDSDHRAGQHYNF